MVNHTDSFRMDTKKITEPKGHMDPSNVAIRSRKSLVAYPNRKKMVEVEATCTSQ